MNKIVDFHSHILPRIDDGSGSLGETLAMLRMEAEQGVARVVATPHFYAHRDDPHDFFARRARRMEELREELQRHPDLPAVEAGAEVYYFNGISDADILPRMTVGGRPYVMIEMPLGSWTSRMLHELEEIPGKLGLTPIVAHVDRYIAPLRTHHIPERLESLPVLVQANASFFLRRSTRRMALRMLDEGRIHLLGSDCHDTVERPPNLGYAVKIIHDHLGQEAVERLAGIAEEIFR